MAEKTLKASPLGNRGGLSEANTPARTKQECAPEKVPQQQGLNYNELEHPFRVHIPTHECPECTDVHPVLLSGDAFSVRYKSGPYGY